MIRFVAACLIALAAAAPAAALTVEEKLLDALVAKGAPGDAAVAIVGRLPEGIEPESVTVSALKYDVASGRFIAEVTLPTGRVLGLQGKVEQGIDVPVLTRQVQSGEVVNAEDVVFARMARSRVMRGAIVDAAGVVGFSARRQLRPGVVLRDLDLEKPVVVRKGDAVTLVYRVPGVELTARGKAMANGGVGDSVPVLNVQSRTQVDAVVTGAGAVSVSPQTVAVN